MRLLRQFVLLLLLPTLALGSGWSLRICLQGVLGTEGCCNPETGSSCCSEEAHSSGAPVVGPSGSDDARGCDTCCIHIEASVERPVPTQEPLGEGLQRSQLAALTVSVEAPELHALPAHEHAALVPIHLPPAPPGRCTPLPLRI